MPPRNPRWAVLPRHLIHLNSSQTEHVTNGLHETNGGRRDTEQSSPLVHRVGNHHCCRRNRFAADGRGAGRILSADRSGRYSGGCSGSYVPCLQEPEVTNPMSGIPVASAAPNQSSEHTVQVRVWDQFVRIFHWTLVTAFTVAYLTEDDLLTVHVSAGYVVGVLIVARLIWVFVGSPHARFSDFVYAPATTLRYLRDLVRFRSDRYLGYSPGGGAMVVFLLVLLTLTVTTGLIVYGGDQQAGPLAGLFTRDTGEAVEEVHEVLANITLAFVCAHIGAVVLASFVHRENLVRAMITGYKRR